MSRGRGFEKAVEQLFPMYRSMGVTLAVMPVPTAPSSHTGRSGRPVRVLSGKAPFDIYGFDNQGTFIGVELKSTQRETSISMVSPDSSGSGLQFHQMDALAALANSRGVARIAWENEGEWGILKNSDILEAWSRLCDAVKAERAGNKPLKGAKSIPWDRFLRSHDTDPLLLRQ